MMYEILIIILIIIYDTSREKVFHCQHFHLKLVLNQNVGIEKLSAPPERPLWGQRKKKQKAKETQGREKRGPRVYGRFAHDLFRQRPVKLLKSFHVPVGSVP